MSERYSLFNILAQRRLLALQRRELGVRQRSIDGAHTVGTLGMARTGIVAEKARVGEEKRGHSCYPTLSSGDDFQDGGTVIARCTRGTSSPSCGILVSWQSSLPSPT